VCGNLLWAVFKVVVKGQTSNINGKIPVLSETSGWSELCHTESSWLLISNHV